MTLLGQAREITGTVVSADDGGTLPGVSVAVKGTSIGTITDMNGQYQLNVPANTEIIVFSFVGLLKQEIAISGQNQIDVTMESDLLQIDEVVVTAMGIRKEKKALGYSVQEIHESEISGAKNKEPILLQGFWI